MKPPIAIFATAFASVALVACGAAGKRARPDNGPSGRASATYPQAADPRSSAHAYDGDDATVLNEDRAAKNRDLRQIAMLVTRYYAAAARADGATACALTEPTFAATVPASYGQELGSAIPPGAQEYLRGARTCAAVLSLLFEHEHSQLAAPVHVTSARLHGAYGYALVGSGTLPISLIEVAREGKHWKIDGLLGRPLP